MYKVNASIVIEIEELIDVDGFVKLLKSNQIISDENVQYNESGVIDYIDPIDAEIEFGYNPGERQTYFDPGCPAEYELYSVQIEGVEVEEFINENRLEFDELVEEYRERNFS